MNGIAPRSFKVRFIEPGIMSYNDQNAGIVLVSKEALDNMAPTFRNCPVIFVPEHHNDSDKDNSFNFEDVGSNPASGIVTGVPYWGDDGWQWVDVSVWDEDAIDAIDNKGYSVSCAYEPEEDITGGIWHELEYNSEVVTGKYMHMAIVPRPRYEGSRIIANSKGGINLPGINFFKKKNAAPVAPAKAPVAPAKEPEGDEKPMLANDDATVDVNGTPVPLHELMAAYMEKQGTGEPAALEDTDEVQLPDGTRVTIADLKAAYSGGEGEGMGEDGEQLNNAEAPQDVQGEQPVDEKRQRSNSAPAVRKVNTALKNAASGSAGFDPKDGMDSQTDRLARGNARYSLPVKQGGK